MGHWVELGWLYLKLLSTNYTSIGFLVVVLLVIEDEKSSQAFMHTQIILSTLCQFFAHALATVMFNKRVNFMSIEFLVVVLLVIGKED